MTYIDPIIKKYYDLFTYGKYADKLEEVKNFYKVYRHIMDDLVPITNEYGGTVIATLVDAVVGEDGRGYGLLNVLCWVDGKNYPYSTLTDIAWIENGVVHTWFPYQKIAYYRSDGTVGTARLEPENMGNYETRDKALSFIRKTSMDAQLHESISKGIINGIYEDADLAEALETIKGIGTEVVEEDDKDVMSYANMLDAFGLEAKEPMEEIEDLKDIQQSEMKMLFTNEPEEDNDEIDEVIDIDYIDGEYTERPMDEEYEENRKVTIEDFDLD